MEAKSPVSIALTDFLRQNALIIDFDNKFQYQNIFETHCPSYLFSNKIPNFLTIYNVPVLSNSFLLPGFR